MWLDPFLKTSPLRKRIVFSFLCRWGLSRDLGIQMTSMQHACSQPMLCFPSLSETGSDDVGSIRLEKTGLCKKKRWKRFNDAQSSEIHLTLSLTRIRADWMIRNVICHILEKACPQKSTSLRKDSATYRMCAGASTVRSVWSRSRSGMSDCVLQGGQGVTPHEMKMSQVHPNRKILKC